MIMNKKIQIKNMYTKSEAYLENNIDIYRYISILTFLFFII